MNVTPKKFGHLVIEISEKFQKFTSSASSALWSILKLALWTLELANPGHFWVGIESAAPLGLKPDNGVGFNPFSRKKDFSF